MAPVDACGRLQQLVIDTSPCPQSHEEENEGVSTRRKSRMGFLRSRSR
jgi:hypothetical protein